MAVTGLAERAAIVQRELSDNVRRYRPEKARTLATFEQGTRKQDGRLAGYQFGYWKDHAHGQTLYSPMTGDNSFKKSTKQKTGSMFVNGVFRNMNFSMDFHIMRDMAKGFIPDSYIKERKRRISTHMMKKNWASIAGSTGAIASVSSASGTTITCLADNSARNTSKGVYRLNVTDSTDPLLYDCVNPANDAVLATFYITAKPTNVTATAVFTVGNAAAMNANTYKICESGFWKKEMNGIADLISDSTSRIFQGADVSVDEFLVNPSVSAGSAVVTPTMVHSAKSIMLSKSNMDGSDDFGFIAHITPTNFRDLAKFGYTSRSYQVNDDKKAQKTYGLPNLYEDGDTIWVQDADYEDCFIDFRERKAFFEYVQKEFGLFDDGSGSRKQWQGAYAAGSTTSYENYNEAVNLCWDGGDNEEATPATSVTIKSIAINTTSSQYVVGV